MRSFAVPAVLFALVAASAPVHAATTETTLIDFNFLGIASPHAGLIADPAGNYYGTTATSSIHGTDGAVFMLTPPPAGQTAWTETTLYLFTGVNGDGAAPQAGLVRDAHGDLYGTTSGGGAHHLGALFMLSPPQSGQTAWTETILHSFSGPDGNAPTTELALDPAGALYGTTQFGGAFDSGVVFKLSPPRGGQTGWTGQVLRSFACSATDACQPASGLLISPSGALFGTLATGPQTASSQGSGAIFRLDPPPAPQTPWSETLLYSFAGRAQDDGDRPDGTLVADSSGALYGVTGDGGALNLGTVFKLVPPAAGQTAWTETQLHSFTRMEGALPASGLLRDKAGTLYGTASGGQYGLGVVFAVSPPALGQTNWREASFSFGPAPYGGQYPYGIPAFGPSNTLIGTTSSGGSNINEGLVFCLGR